MDRLFLTDDAGPFPVITSWTDRNSASPWAARQLAANDFMYWEVMRRACERGYRIFDFGRSKIGTGSYAFKCNWGFQPRPLVYQFRLAPGRSMPDLNPLNPKLAVFIAAWKHLPL